KMSGAKRRKSAASGERGAGKGAQPLSPLSTQRPRRALTRRLRATTFLTHGITTHFDAVSVVNQAVEDTVSGSGIADLFVPAGNRQLRGQDRRTGLVTIFADFPEVAAFGFG